MITKNDDLRYITTPDLWVMWPFCPLKRMMVGQREFGYIIAAEGELTNIRAGNIYMAKAEDPVRWSYDSPEALLADCWEVD